jgi:hypothetical protein
MRSIGVLYHCVFIALSLSIPAVAANINGDANQDVVAVFQTSTNGSIWWYERSSTGQALGPGRVISLAAFGMWYPKSLVVADLVRAHAPCTFCRRVRMHAAQECPSGSPYLIFCSPVPTCSAPCSWSC